MSSCYYCKHNYYDEENDEQICEMEPYINNVDTYNCPYFEFDTGLIEEDIEEIDSEDPYWGDDLDGSFYELSTDSKSKRMET